MNPLPEIAGLLIEHYGERLRDAPALAHDALTATLDNGVILELRFAGAEEYSLRWQHDGRVFAIDTAPLHPELATFPNHLHAPDGGLGSDPLTQPGRAPWDNVRALVERVLDDPLLERQVE